MVSLARPAARRPRLRRQGRGRAVRGHQHLHRLQPGLPRPHLQRQDHLLPGQPARLPRDRAGARARPGCASASPWSAPAPRGSPARSPPPSAATPSPSSTPRPRSAASSTSPARSPARRSSTRPSATSARSSKLHGVDVRLNTPVDRRTAPRRRSTRSSSPPASPPHAPRSPGVDHPSVVGYLDVLRDGAPVGDRVAILGAGGIGFDVAEFLTDGGDKASQDPAAYFRQLGRRHGLPGAPAVCTAPERPAPPRTVHLLQRKTAQGRRRTRQDHRLDPPHRTAAPRASPWSPGASTTASTTPGCTSPSTA